ALLQLKAIIREFDPDIVHTHASKAGALGRVAAFQCGVKTVVHTFHGNVFEHYFGRTKSMLYKGVERYLAKKSSGIVAISKQQKLDLVERHTICGADKVKIIPLGFDLANFGADHDRKREAARSRFSLDLDTIAVGIIGRLVPIKGHRLFLKALATAVDQGKKVRAIVVGDGELKEDLTNYSLELGLALEKDIIFHSWEKQVEEILPAFDLVALSSLREGTPVSLIEAQAAGIPVLSTRVGGVEDIVSPGAGWVVDRDEFVDTFIRLSSNPRLLQETRFQGQKWACDNFSAQRLANDMDRFYRTLL
ncbi:MAG: glycosyltransferase, partial [Flavobacteriales bacterium]|nr:glycosyltransferase [Flavobacteriales bacterium]